MLTSQIRSLFSIILSFKKYIQIEEIFCNRWSKVQQYKVMLQSGKKSVTLDSLHFFFFYLKIPTKPLPLMYP